MRAYQDMLYGKHKGNSKIKDEYKNAFLRYCKLDTLAMHGYHLGALDGFV